VVDTFNAKSAKCVKEAQQLVRKPSLKADLAFIKANLGFLPDAILQLEEAGLPLNRSLEIVANARKRINSIPGDKGVQSKLDFTDLDFTYLKSQFYVSSPADQFFTLYKDSIVDKI